MGKVFKLSELKGKVKAGWVLKTSGDNHEECSNLTNGKEDEVTEVLENGLRIGGCYHSYSESWSVEVVGGDVKDFDNLEYGDILIDENTREYRVLDTLPHVIFLSNPNNGLTEAWYGRDELRDMGWKIKIAEPETTELTLKEIADKFNIKVDKLRVKDN